MLLIRVFMIVLHREKSYEKKYFDSDFPVYPLETRDEDCVWAHIKSGAACRYVRS